MLNKLKKIIGAFDIADVFTFGGLIIASVGIWHQYNLNISLMFAGGVILLIGIFGSR